MNGYNCLALLYIIWLASIVEFCRKIKDILLDVIDQNPQDLAKS